MYSKVREHIMSKYSLYNGQVLKRSFIEEISINEGIEIKDLIYVLGLYYGLLHKENNLTSKINLNKNRTIRENVKIILVDLKYLEGYGHRSYTAYEIEEICYKYNMDIYDFIRYVSRYESCYDNNLEIILNNKNGLWIGDKPELSIEFFEENYNEIILGLKGVCKAFLGKYGNIKDFHELFDVGYNAILLNGQLEKNYSFDKERIISKLLFRAKYAMLECLIESFKFTSYEVDRQTRINCSDNFFEKILKISMKKQI